MIDEGVEREREKNGQKKTMKKESDCVGEKNRETEM